MASDALRSRIATLKQAVDAIACEGNGIFSSCLVDARGHFTIHFVGSDETECPTSDCATLLAIYRPLVDHLRGVCGEGRPVLSKVNIVFVGPNHPSDIGFASGGLDCDGVVVSFEVHVGLYHHYAAAMHGGSAGSCYQHAPALVACFNAGLWGYNDWLPTLQLLNNTEWLPSGAHLLVTAYTLEEGDDDEDVLMEHCPMLHSVVAMSENPAMGTQVLLRESAAEDRRYIDSQMWALMVKGKL